jgi:choloylglycine hydrolase
MKQRKTSYTMKWVATFSAMAVVILLFTPWQQADACTAITLKAQDGAAIQARTEEWGAFDLESELMVTPRGVDLQSTTPDNKPGLKWKSKYGIVGINALHLPYYVDGMNEKGLTISVLFLANLAEYEPYDPKLADKSINPMDLPAWVLSNFATAEEVRAGLPKIKVVPVPMKELRGNPAPVHWILTDPSGKTIVVEYTDGQRHIYDNPVGVMTNNPEFPWHLKNLGNYIGLQAQARGPKKVGDLEVTPHGTVGSGLVGLPGDYSPPSRFVKAVVLRNTVRPLHTAEDAVQEAFRILNSFDIPLGAVDSEAQDKIMGETQWTTAMDTKSLRYYYKTQYNFRLREVDLKAVDFTKGKIRYQPLDHGKKQDYETVTVK